MRGYRNPAWQLTWAASCFSLLVAGALAMLLLAAGGCASWQTTTRKGLQGLHETAKAARPVVEDACRPALAGCIERKENPCPALQRCQAARDKLLLVLLEVQRVVIVGWSAVELADEPTAGKALQAGLDLLRQVQGAMGDLR